MISNKLQYSSMQYLSDQMCKIYAISSLSLLLTATGEAMGTKFSNDLAELEFEFDR